MKKIMFALVAVTMAACANAAAVSWSSGIVYSPDTGAKIGKQTGDWTMTLAFFTDAAGATAFAATGDLSDSSTTTVSKFSGNAEGFSNGSTYYVQAIITDKASKWSIDSGIVGFTVADTGDASIDFSDGTGLLSGTAAWDTTKTAASGTGAWVAVPEPTSGLLLLLGMAGLALRRKHA